MLSQLEKIGFVDKCKSFAPLAIRILTGFHLVYTTKNIVFNATEMQGVIDFFTSQKIPAASFLAPLTVYAEFFCGLLILIGLFTRAAGGIMLIVFVCAIGFVHIGDSYTNTFPALVLLAGSLSLFLSGAGKFSLDNIVRRKTTTL